MTGAAGRATYFLTVFLEIPSCLAMPLRGTPYSLACCTAFHRACLRGDASLGGGVSCCGASASSWRWGTAASRAARRYSCNLDRPCWARFLTT